MRSQSRQLSSIARLVMTLPSALRRRRDIREVEPEIVSRGDQKPWVVQLLAEGQLPGVNAEPRLRAVEVEEVFEEEPPAAPAIALAPTPVEPELVAEVLEPAPPREVEPEEEPEPQPVAEVVKAAPPIEVEPELVAEVLEPAPPREVEPEEEPEPQPVAEVVKAAPPIEVEPELVAEVLEPAPPVEVEPEPEEEPESQPVAEVVKAAPPIEVEPEPVEEISVVEELPKPSPPKPTRKRARTKHRPVTRVAAPPPERAAAHVPAPAEVEPTESQADEVACEIRLWRGYRKANFFACVFSDHGEPLAVAESPFFRVHGSGVPERTEEAVAAHEQLRAQLEAAGWRHAASGKTWFGDLFSRPL